MAAGVEGKVALINVVWHESVRIGASQPAIQPVQAGTRLSLRKAAWQRTLARLCKKATRLYCLSACQATSHPMKWGRVKGKSEDIIVRFEHENVKDPDDKSVANI